MIERRKAPRHRVLKGATIAFDGIGLDCTVRNLSESGAALDFSTAVSVPPTFMLTIQSDRLRPSLPSGLEQRQADRRRF